MMASGRWPRTPSLALEMLPSKSSTALATRRGFTGGFLTLPAPSPDHSVSSHIHPDQLRAQPAPQKDTPTPIHMSPKPSISRVLQGGALPLHAPSRLAVCLAHFVLKSPPKISPTSLSLQPSARVSIRFDLRLTTWGCRSGARFLGKPSPWDPALGKPTCLGEGKGRAQSPPPSWFGQGPMG